LGWIYVVGLRRSFGGSQVLLDAACLEFQARPVVPIMDAVRVELEAIAFRDELRRK